MNRIQPHLLIRADASPAIGTGHVMRCMALAAAWCERNGNVTFACRGLPGLLRDRILRSGFDVHELSRAEPDATQAEELRALAEQLASHWVVFDGYQFSSEYVQAMQSCQRKTLVIHDDLSSEFPTASLLLNQNVHAKDCVGGDDQRQLLGVEFALLRPEMKSTQTKKCADNATRLLLTCGGSDDQNVTLNVLEILEQTLPESFVVDVVVGACNPNWAILEDHSRTSRLDIRLQRNVDRMNALLSRADLAVTAGGSTCYELAHFGVPFVVLPIAPNQEPVARGLQAEQVGLGLNLSKTNWQLELAEKVNLLISNPVKRQDMSRRGRLLVDGRGAARVCQLMRELELELCPVSMEDAERLFEWRHDKQVMQASFHEPPKSYKSHRAWLESQINSARTLFCIVQHSTSGPIGQIRIEINRAKNSGVVGISLANPWRGLGYGYCLIQQAARLANDSGLSSLKAHIKPDNCASIAAFEKAGFTKSGKTEINGQSALELTVVLEPRNRKAA